MQKEKTDENIFDDVPIYKEGGDIEQGACKTCNYHLLESEPASVAPSLPDGVKIWFANSAITLSKLDDLCEMTKSVGSVPNKLLFWQRENGLIGFTFKRIDNLKKAKILQKEAWKFSWYYDEPSNIFYPYESCLNEVRVKLKQIVKKEEVEQIMLLYKLVSEKNSCFSN